MGGWLGEWPGGWVVGESGNKANSAQLSSSSGLSWTELGNNNTNNNNIVDMHDGIH